MSLSLKNKNYSEYCSRKWIDPKDLEKEVALLRKEGKKIATLQTALLTCFMLAT